MTGKRKITNKKQEKKKRTHLEMETENNISLGIKGNKSINKFNPSLKINYKFELINEYEKNNLS